MLAEGVGFEVARKNAFGLPLGGQPPRAGAGRRSPLEGGRPPS